jgi:hypothetical protein
MLNYNFNFLLSFSINFNSQYDAIVNLDSSDLFSFMHP